MIQLFMQHYSLLSGIMGIVLAVVVFYSLYSLDVIHLDGRKISVKGGITTTLSTMIVFSIVVILAMTIINPLINSLSHTQAAGDFLFFIGMVGVGACIPVAIMRVDSGLKKLFRMA